LDMVLFLDRVRSNQPIGQTHTRTQSNKNLKIDFFEFIYFYFFFNIYLPSDLSYYSVSGLGCF